MAQDGETRIPESPDAEGAAAVLMGSGYASWFRVSQTPLWLEDFSDVARRFQELRDSGVHDLPRSARGSTRQNPGAFSRLVKILDANPAAAELLQADSPQILIGDLDIGFDEESYGHFLEELIKIARGQRRFSVDIIGKTFHGERRYLRMQWTAAPDASEDLSLVYISAVDLTELVLTETSLRDTVEAKDFLLREIQHRVRNTLALINSLLSMQTDANPSAQVALLASARRVETLAVVHDSLYQKGDPSLADLRDCVEGVSRQVFSREAEGRPIDLVIEVDEREISVEITSPLALITGELVSNAVRHGCRTGQQCTVRVKAKNESGLAISLEVRDGGHGFDPVRMGKQTRGLGLSLIGALVSQLGAEIAYDSADGFTVRVSVPLHR